jgi:uncharacterized protein YfaQ (DUF2300 family)
MCHRREESQSQMHVTALPVALPSPSVLRHALDAEGVLHRAHTGRDFPARQCSGNRIASIRARNVPSAVGREHRDVRNGGLHFGPAIMAGSNSEHVLELPA